MIQSFKGTRNQRFHAQVRWTRAFHNLRMSAFTLRFAIHPWWLFWIPPSTLQLPCTEHGFTTTAVPPVETADAASEALQRRHLRRPPFTRPRLPSRGGHGPPSGHPAWRMEPAALGFSSQIWAAGGRRPAKAGARGGRAKPKQMGTRGPWARRTAALGAATVAPSGDGIGGALKGQRRRA